ncbi:hypothetical protein OsI_29457 [Oryza sativa Indica Group]|uniref:Uncharacterized protein n=1 Tax=Oryza sativa subsp. indica TaxID=39946 RepID=A2YVV1_ORYSI|nr:hypothetical protein OsI_29457 [Oryza sativa Indica Group]
MDDEDPAAVMMTPEVETAGRGGGSVDDEDPAVAERMTVGAGSGGADGDREEEEEEARMEQLCPNGGWREWRRRLRRWRALGLSLAAVLEILAALRHKI